MADDDLGYGDVIGELRGREGELVQVDVAAGFDLVAQGELGSFGTMGEEGVRFNVGAATVRLRHRKFARASCVDDGVLVLSTDGGMFLFQWGDGVEE
jgi:hypothetical protein